MAYASKAGRAKASPSNPQAFGVCDRCGIWNQRVALRPQWDWAGPSLINKQLLVCGQCYDTPAEQLRAIVLPADPVPIDNPRTEPYLTDEANLRTTQGNSVDFFTGIPIPGGDTRITQDDARRTTQQTGEPPGGLNQEPGTDPNMPGPIGIPPDNDEVPKTGPL
jgi:hypothetical protein